MIHLVIPINNTVSNKQLFASNFLISFKHNLINNCDINKFNLRYDYLINNNELEFINSFRIPTNKLINTIANSFLIKNISSNNTSICLFDHVNIPNTNMTISAFVRFIEYGNFDMLPYPWIKNAWNKTLQQYELDRKVL